MKNSLRTLFLTLFAVFLYSTVFCQGSTNFVNKPDSASANDTTGMPIGIFPLAGSCGSPDGPLKEITDANRACCGNNGTWLQNNGYCWNYGTSTTQMGCYTFSAPSCCIDIGGQVYWTWRGLGQCQSYTTAANLYDASCNLVGTGFSFNNLVPGATYTFCYERHASCNNDAGSTVDRFCLWFNDTAPLDYNYVSSYHIDIQKVGENVRLYWYFSNPVGQTKIERLTDKGMVMSKFNTTHSVYEDVDYTNVFSYRVSNNGRSQEILNPYFEPKRAIFIENGQINLRVYTKYEIFDSKGKLIRTGHGSFINVEGYPNGFYYVRFNGQISKVVLIR
jgi:hypothetical protein